MKKVICIVGSRNHASKGLAFCNELLIRLKDFYNEIDYKILTPNDYFLEPIDGSNETFYKGIDKKDDIDDGSVIKHDLEAADFVIFCTPVYSHNVSGDIKILIDRLSYWGHIFKLLGKSGLTVTVADSNGFIQVDEYIDKILTGFGVDVVDNIILTRKDDVQKFDYLPLIEDIVETFQPNYKIKVSTFTESQFKSYKSSIQKQPHENFEYRYWSENKLFYSETLQDYVDKYLN
ncbi:NAD(P)H-dependent oxidoreductase [Mammaliicoccus vitulinus]|uniref:NAD(P)H-dependent oxidoreductase n=1 Tax=Mammaliicoccus vitulinus TaxID=71237 RepID=UPI000D1D58BB|nr:NAD(P)H-dependent oxidoreductase [Mammaliicoccus vitulinus]PTI89131.1 FMN reductase [Mammaliicoccus vitulinus]